MTQGFDLTLLMLITTLFVPFTGVLMAITPYLMRRGEVFAVTVPASAQQDPFVKRLKRRYAAAVLLATAVFTIAGAACTLAGNGAGVMVVLIGGELVLLVGGYALMLRYRSLTRAYKREQGWVAAAQEAVAVVGEQPVPRAISLKWNLLYVPVILVTAAIGIAAYPHMPDLIPLHADFDGTVNRWEPKGPGVVAFPVIVQLFLVACFAFSHWIILRSKKWSEPGAPATSALAYGLFARAQSVFLLVSGVLVAACVGLAFELSALGAISLGQAAVVVLVATLPLVAGSLVISAVYGQAGSRVFKRMQATDELLVDDDCHWKLGVFYCNPDDASLFLPERFGVGWTVNWARPAAWAIMAGSVLVSVAFVAALALFA